MASEEPTRNSTSTILDDEQTTTTTPPSPTPSPSSPPPQATSSPLLSLPPELLTHILLYLTTPAPSATNFHSLPSPFLTSSPSPSPPSLKTLSLTSRSVRSFLLPLLFTHTRLDPVTTNPTQSTTSFLDFIHRNELTGHVESLVAHLPSPATHLHPQWWWGVLTVIPLRTLSVLCPPYVFAELAGVGLVGTDSWVFNMPYHILRLQQDTPTLTPTSTNTSSGSTSHLFTARPWTHLSINESSSLKAYSQYEYFLRKTPSLLAALHPTPSPSIASTTPTPNTPTTSPIPLTLTPYTTLLTNLLSFTYTAIFPFYNHVDTVLQSVRAMPNLTHLTFKLCPEPDSSVIDDEIQLAQGHIDVNDAWMEFDTSYTLITHTVIYLTPENGGNGKLEVFKVEDVKWELIREGLEKAVSQRLQEWWVHVGDGVWKRKGAGEGVVDG